MASDAAPAAPAADDSASPSAPPPAVRATFAQRLAAFQLAHGAGACAFRDSVLSSAYERGSGAAGAAGCFRCDYCPRVFDTDRGLKRHRHACRQHMLGRAGADGATPAAKLRRLDAGGRAEQPVMAMVVDGGGGGRGGMSATAAPPGATDRPRAPADDEDEEGGGEDDGGGVYTCDLCARTFDSSRGLKRHRHACLLRRAAQGGDTTALTPAPPRPKYEPNANGEWACDLCAKVCANERGLKRHRFHCLMMRRAAEAAAAGAPGAEAALDVSVVRVERLPAAAAARVPVLDGVVVGVEGAVGARAAAGGAAGAADAAGAEEEESELEELAQAAPLVRGVARGARARGKAAAAIPVLPPVPLSAGSGADGAESAIDGWVRRQVASLQPEMSPREIGAAAGIIPQLPRGEVHLSEWLARKNLETEGVRAVRAKLLRWLELRDEGAPPPPPSAGAPRAVVPSWPLGGGGGGGGAGAGGAGAGAGGAGSGSPTAADGAGGASSQARAMPTVVVTNAVPLSVTPAGAGGRGDGSETRRRLWSAEDDEKLHCLVGQHGTDRWAFVATHFHDRTAKQCRLRFTNYLAPEVSRDGYTPQEDAKLLQVVEELGARWAQVAAMMPGRRPDSVRNRWRALHPGRMGPGSPALLPALLDGSGGGGGEGAPAGAEPAAGGGADAAAGAEAIGALLDDGGGDAAQRGAPAEAEAATAAAEP